VAKIIELPKLSPTMEEGTLVRWARAEGDRVQIDDLLAEVETDKATMEFRSFDTGTLLRRLVPEGATARLGQPVAIFGDPGEDIRALLAQIDAGSTSPTVPQRVEPQPAAAPAPVSAPAAHVVAPVPGTAGLLLRAPARAPSVVSTTVGPSSPRVRRLARERGVPLAAFRGSGEHGRIVPADLDRPLASTPARTDDTVKPASQMRKAIARRLTESKREVPHFYLEAELEVDSLLTLREQINHEVDPAVKVSINDLFVRACALALTRVPEANASWDGGNIVEHHRVDISVAVAVDDGLLTPVLRNADAKSLRQIAMEVRELAGRARARKLRPEELTGGVFSISNLGMFGVDRFAAVINPPESMILAVGRVRDVAAVRGGLVVPAKRCSVTLSCDHRVVDGARGARFLDQLRGFVERPATLLL